MRKAKRCDPSVTAEVIAALSLAVWLYLLTARGAFWLCGERDDWHSPPLAQWPRVAAIVPARNEADTIASSIGSLLESDRAVPEPQLEHLFKVVLAFDQSDVELPATAREVKIEIARRLIDRYYEGHSPEQKRKALEQLTKVAE